MTSTVDDASPPSPPSGGTSWAVAVALTWSDAWSQLARADDGARRREEYRSHLVEARAAGVSGTRLLVEALRGAVDDVRWCNDSRRAGGQLPLGQSVVADANMAFVAVTAVMALVYLVSLYGPAQPIVDALLALAGGLAVVAFGRGIIGRFTRRSDRTTP